MVSFVINLFIYLFILLDLRSRLKVKKLDQDEDVTQKTAQKSSVKLVREKELDERIQRIKQQNEVILKRAKEVQAEKLKFSWHSHSTVNSL